MPGLSLYSVPAVVVGGSLAAAIVLSIDESLDLGRIGDGKAASKPLGEINAAARTVIVVLSIVPLGGLAGVSRTLC